MGVDTASEINSRNASTLMSGMRIENLRLPSGVEVQPTGGPCGTILRGVDLSEDLPAEVISLIITLFNHSGVLIIPGQNRLTPQRQMEVTEWFGRPFNRDGGDKYDDIRTVDGTRVQNVSGGSELKPHSDAQDYEIPADVTVLHGIEVPPAAAGGCTLFANLFRAYDELDDAMKRRVDRMRWHPASTLATAYRVGIPQAVEYVKQHGVGVLESDVTHPVVRTHPVSGRKALWISTFTVKMVGIEDRDENKAMVQFLKQHVTQPHLWYTHKWTAHDVIMWDNRCVNHWRQNWDHQYRRIMHRSQAGGSRPF
ncbi:MAG TPA: TauD/TfdA family dioxygenase [Candidatus Binataceae bacterium]|nr:TauD/TfdA family dioxygenase [Candidatus Binataceae bacterium]